MKIKPIFILIIMILLMSNFTIAEDTSSDILVNIVKQETQKVKSSVNIHIDNEFNTLRTEMNETMMQIEDNVNNQIKSNNDWQLVKLIVGAFCSFLLALIISRLLLLKQERNNPFYLEYKDKIEQMKKSKELLKSKNELEQEKIKSESVKGRLSDKNGIFGKLKKIKKEDVNLQIPKKPEVERTFTKEEVIALMNKQKKELIKEESDDLDSLYKEMK